MGISKNSTQPDFLLKVKISREQILVSSILPKIKKNEKACLRTRRSNVFVLSFVFWKNEDRIN